MFFLYVVIFFFKHLLCAHRLIIFALSLSLLHYVWPIKSLSFEIRYYAKQIETVCMYAFDLQFHCLRCYFGDDPIQLLAFSSFATCMLSYTFALFTLM